MFLRNLKCSLKYILVSIFFLINDLFDLFYLTGLNYVRRLHTANKSSQFITAANYWDQYMSWHTTKPLGTSYIYTHLCSSIVSVSLMALASSDPENSIGDKLTQFSKKSPPRFKGGPSWHGAIYVIHLWKVVTRFLL